MASIRPVPAPPPGEPVDSANAHVQSSTVEPWVVTVAASSMGPVCQQAAGNAATRRAQILPEPTAEAFDVTRITPYAVCETIQTKAKEAPNGSSSPPAKQTRS